MPERIINPQYTDLLEASQITEEEKTEPVISHDVRQGIKENLGIPEGEPVALMVHITKEVPGYNIMEHGFVNVSGRGTLADILHNPDIEQENAGVPAIMQTKVGQHKQEGKGVMMITFCVPAKNLRQDTEKYGYWYDNKLPVQGHDKLWEVYNSIAVKYDSQTGEPKEFAKDDSSNYPVYIPKQFVLGVARLEQ